MSCSVVNPSARNEPTEQGTSDQRKGSEEDPKEDTQNMNFPDPVASSILTDNHQPVVVIANGHTGTNHEPFLGDTGPLTTHSMDSLTLTKENGDVPSNSEMMVDDSGVSSFRQAVLLDLNSPAADNEQNETHHGTATGLQGEANSQNNPIGSGESNPLSLKDPNKSADSYNGEARDEFHGLESANNILEPGKQAETASTGPVDDLSLVCLYRCCSQCVSILQDSMHKLVTRELRLGRSYITTEGIHDAVSSLSVELIAAVRKFISAKNNGTTQEAKVEEHEECPEKEACSCKSLPGNFLASVECCSHSAQEQGSLDEANTYPTPKTWLEPVFVFRDGILVPVSAEDDRALHCKYDSFCLGSLIELIATEMKPF